MKILYDSKEVRSHIRELFERGKGRRVAIVAFVGHEAEAYLRRPKGIELYCWDAPGTSPEAVAELQRRKVKCFFVANTHMKVYYAAGVGCVITSANLSKYALAGSRLHEAGVFLRDGVVDIDRFLKRLKPRKVTPVLLAKLRSTIAKTKRQFGGSGKSGRRFDDWFNLPASERKRPTWRFSPYSLTGVKGNTAVETERRENHNRKKWHGLIECGAEVRPETFLLETYVRAGKLSGWKWTFVDDVLPYSKSERTEDGCSHQAVQWHSSSTRDAPFTVDAPFKRAFRAALDSVSPRERKRYLSDETVHALPESFLNVVADHYRRLAP